LSAIEKIATAYQRHCSLKQLTDHSSVIDRHDGPPGMIQKVLRWIDSKNAEDRAMNVAKGATPGDFWNHQVAFNR